MTGKSLGKTAARALTALLALIASLAAALVFSAVALGVAFQGHPSALAFSLLAIALCLAFCILFWRLEVLPPLAMSVALLMATLYFAPQDTCGSESACYQSGSAGTSGGP